MKIGVISDTHIPDRAADIPGQVLEAFKGMDMVIHAGDLVSLEVLEKLRGACPDVRAVQGNMDYEEVKNKLPQKEIIEAAGLKIGLMHGYGSPQELPATLGKSFKDDGVDIIVFGHSHNSFNEKIGEVLYFNPGSPTDKVFSLYNSYGVIKIDNGKAEGKIIKL